MKEYFHLKEYGFRQLIQEIWKRADESQIFNHSAKLAYFFLLSLFPLLLFFMMAVGRVLSTAKDVQQQLTHYLQTILPAAASGLIEESVRQMSNDSSSVWASLGFKLYLNTFSQYTVIYGSVGAFIILMLWLYISGMTLLIGGLINSILRKSPVT